MPNMTIPTKPGRYWWSEYGQVFDVYRKKGGKHLYIRPTGIGPYKIELRVTPRLAGRFTYEGELRCPAP